MSSFGRILGLTLLAFSANLRAAAPAVVPPPAGIEQRLGVQLPPDVALRDETGAPVTSGDLWSARPLLLVFAYFGCQRLCPLALHDLDAALAGARLEAGDDANVAIVSIDPNDDPAAAAAAKAKAGAAGWRFLTGTDAASARLAEAAGFGFSRDDATGELRHAAAVIVVTPKGRIARYLRGPGFTPRDLRLAVTEAGESIIARPLDQLFLFCYHYDASTGRYGAAVSRLLKAFGAASLAGLGALVWRASRPRLGGAA